MKILNKLNTAGATADGPKASRPKTAITEDKTSNVVPSIQKNLCAPTYNS